MLFEIVYINFMKKLITLNIIIFSLFSFTDKSPSEKNVTRRKFSFVYQSQLEVLFTAINIYKLGTPILCNQQCLIMIKIFNLQLFPKIYWHEILFTALLLL